MYPLPVCAQNPRLFQGEAAQKPAYTMLAFGLSFIPEAPTCNFSLAGECTMFVKLTSVRASRTDSNYHQGHNPIPARSWTKIG